MTDIEWTIQKILTWMTTHFTAKGIPSARLDAEILLTHVLKCKRLDLYLKFDQPLQEPELKTLRELIVRRAKREPVAYIIGNQEFYGRNFNVGRGVLIPRPETEHLIDEALLWLKHHKVTLPTPAGDRAQTASAELTLELFKSEAQYKTEDAGNELEDTVKIERPDLDAGSAAELDKVASALPEIFVLDVGSGSGCLGITLALEFGHVQVTAVDKSEAGCKFTRENAGALGVAGRVKVVHQAFEEFHPEIKFDLIVTNPPYIAEDLRGELQAEVDQFEPDEALYGGAQGHETIERWLPKLSALLKPGGLLLCEIGYDQGPVASKLTRDQGQFGPIEILKDYSGHQRILKAVRHQI